VSDPDKVEEPQKVMSALDADTAFVHIFGMPPIVSGRKPQMSQQGRAESNGDATSWQESLERHITNLQHMATHVDVAEVNGFLDAIRNCSGLIVFTGVGQNSLLADKIASTYASLSMRSTSIDAVAFLHGNLGMLRRPDLIVMLSHSGETRELYDLAQACDRLGYANTFAVHSTPGCSLSRLCHRSVHVPTLGEADRLDLVPSASSCCFLSFLQAVAIQLAAEGALTLQRFVSTHPGGTLGRRGTGAGR